jgi:hypothetical protein
MADIEARVNENSPIGFFTWCWTIVVEITDGRIGSIPGIRPPPATTGPIADFDAFETAASKRSFNPR